MKAEKIALGWEERPMNRPRLLGRESDLEDNVLKEFLISSALLSRSAAVGRDPTARVEDEKGMLQVQPNKSNKGKVTREE